MLIIYSSIHHQHHLTNFLPDFLAIIDVFYKQRLTADREKLMLESQRSRVVELFNPPLMRSSQI